MPYILKSGVGSSVQPNPLMMQAESRKAYDFILESYSEDVLKLPLVDGKKLKWKEYGYQSGYRLPKPETPFIFDCSISPSRLRNCIHTNCGPIISKETVEVMERMEPNVHQFIAVELNMKKGSTDREYFIPNICNLLKTLNFKKTTSMGPMHCPPERRHLNRNREYLVAYANPAVNIEKPYETFASRSEIGACKFWAEYGFMMFSSIFCADEFIEEMKSVGGHDAFMLNKYVVAE